MDQAILEIYESQLKQLSEQPRFRRTVQLITTAEQKNVVKIRADATLFLATSLMEMVVQPLLIAAEQGDVTTAISLSENEIFNRAENDIDLIVRDADQIRQERDSVEISASSAIEALGRRIRELSLDDFQIWDD